MVFDETVLQAAAIFANATISSNQTEEENESNCTDGKINHQQKTHRSPLTRSSDNNSSSDYDSKAENMEPHRNTYRDNLASTECQNCANSTIGNKYCGDCGFKKTGNKD